MERRHKALAAELGIGYGSLARLKQKLVEVGFVKITEGDWTSGEADEWHILDIWERNEEMIADVQLRADIDALWILQ